MISANDRLHYHVRAEITSYLRSLPEKTTDSPVYDKDNPCTVSVDIRPPTKRRMDAPNWYPTVKALIDGFVDKGLLEDDNNHVIKEISFMSSGTSGHKNYEVEITFRKLPLTHVADEIERIMQDHPCVLPYYKLSAYLNGDLVDQNVTFDREKCKKDMVEAFCKLVVKDYRIDHVKRETNKVTYQAQTNQGRLDIVLELGDACA